MTQPDDATEALPTRRVPAEGALPTQRFAAAPAEPTVHVGRGEPTVYLGGGEQTVHVGRGEPTVYLGGGEPTVHVGQGQPTGYLAAAAPPPTDETVRLTPGSQPTHAAWDAQPTHAAWDEPTASAGRTTVEPGPTGHAVPTAAPGGEVRFGPGVPPAPPTAPAWPATPPRPRRSLWRSATTVLSTLLTLALLAAVGLWIWQRLSPLEVTGVTVAVPQPAGDRCDVTVDVIATVTTNGRAGTVEYQWLRSDSAPGAVLTERVGRGQRSVELTLRWTFSGVGATTETATVNLVAPTTGQASAEVAYACRG
ncbi:hypothetical protein GA0070616_5556 [Micromonospora nigra]|uniref:Uncharacterized protein n=1 Tax=Micromonospora nigra TaxID=145857 RepID=A0A1C6T4Y1_9ACTN|nr:hypothetical protein [Micromonospora nigra]SCL36699.1 hypothetical protein GA0070616_5556 [Micromonospora nigra]